MIDFPVIIINKNDGDKILALYKESPEDLELHVFFDPPQG